MSPSVVSCSMSVERAVRLDLCMGTRQTRTITVHTFSRAEGSSRYTDHLQARTDLSYSN